MIDETPIVLYDNESGSTGNITLNDSIANYKYITIYYKSPISNDRGFVRVWNNNSYTSEIDMTMNRIDEFNTYYNWTTTIKINETSLTYFNSCQWLDTTKTTGVNPMKILRIEGSNI